MPNYVIPKFEGEYRFLSNFYNSSITIVHPSGAELLFPTAEHMFQALKYKAATSLREDLLLEYVQMVMSNPDPNHAKKMGRKIKIDVAKWDDMKIDMMRETVWEKFKQNQNLVVPLLDTGSAMLVEGNTWGDTFWGRVDGRGFNLLGSILMEVRGAYRWNGATQLWSQSQQSSL